MGKRVWQGSIAAMLFVAGLCVAVLVFSPSVTLAKDKEFVI
jgi:hypothetical protein